MMVVHMLSPDEPLRPALHLQLRAATTCATSCCASTASATSPSSASASTACASGSTPTSSPAFGLTSVATWSPPCRRRTSRCPAGALGQEPIAGRAAPSSSPSPRRAASRTRRSSAAIIVRSTADGRLVRLQRRGPRRARRPGLRHQLLPRRQAGGGARHLPAARAPTRCDAAAAIIKTMEELKKIFPAGRRLRHRLQPDRVHRRSRSTPSTTRWSRRWCWWCWWSWSSCRAGARR